MAEGLLRTLAQERLEVHSAGTAPSHVHPLAIRAMNERGIDIRRHRSKSVEEFAGQPFDYVITVCDAAAEVCPVFPGPARRIHWSLPDPAAAGGGEEERVDAFRRVRARLEAHLREWLAARSAGAEPPAERRD